MTRSLRLSRAIGVQFRPCRWCKEPFLPMSAQAKLCSDECREKHGAQKKKEWHDREITRNRPGERECIHCGGIFRPRSLKHQPKSCTARECKIKDKLLTQAERNEELRTDKKPGGFDDAKAERIWVERFGAQERDYYAAKASPFERKGSCWA